MKNCGKSKFTIKNANKIAMLVLFMMFLNLCPVSANNKTLSLKYNFGGCKDEYYTPEAYYAAPIIKDINKDGKKEIIFVNYSVIVLDAETGQTIWKVNGGYDRNEPYEIFGKDVGLISKVVVDDIDKDGYDEIICGHAKGLVTVLTWDGYMKNGWPKQLCSTDGAAVYRTARSVYTSDIDNDGTSEIIVGASVESAENVWVYKYNGDIMNGWPQLAPSQNAAITQDLSYGYSYGVFMDGVSAADIYGDEKKEIIVATDTAYICAYDINGKLIPANKETFKGRTWGKIALWEDVNTENNMNFNEGWGWDISGNESRSELYRAELGHAVLNICDIDADGKNEVITSAVMCNRDKDIYNGSLISSRYMSLFILNGDRTRFKGWEKAPSDQDSMSAPLLQLKDTLSSQVQAEPVVADLNNDGINEVIINTYDGKVHAFSINNPSREFLSFPFQIPQNGVDFETPSGVVCKDIDADGKKEVIFATNVRSRDD